MGDRVIRRWGLTALAAVALVGVAAASRAVPQAPCPAPRVALWSGIRDTLWPLIAHREGDDGWAHLDTITLPRESATWCNPLQNDAAAIAAARDLYTANCASCHGAEGRGDGQPPGATDPSPYDFTRPEFAGMREPPGPALLYAMLARGIGGTTMPPAPELSGWERLAVLAYVTSLPGPEAVRNSRAWADSLRIRRGARP